MAKQTFTTGQVLTAAQVNTLNTNDFNQTVSVKTAAYTLVAADKGTRIEFNTSGSVTCTVNTGLFDAGDTLVIQNRGAGVVTVTAGTATVNTSATLALSQYDAGTLYFISASAAIFFNTDAGGGSPSSFVGATAYRTTTLSLTADTVVMVTYANEVFDTDGFHSTTTDTSRFTVPSGKAGKYLCIANMFATGGSSRMIMYPYKNGSNVGGSPNFSYLFDNRGFGNAGAMTGGWVMDLVVGDFVELGLYSVANTATLQESTFQFNYLGA